MGWFWLLFLMLVVAVAMYVGYNYMSGKKVSFGTDDIKMFVSDAAESIGNIPAATQQTAQQTAQAANPYIPS